MQIDGIIDLNGQDGQSGLPGNSRFPAVAGTGGFGGGVGATATLAPTPGSGPGGGLTGSCNPGGGGHAERGSDSDPGTGGPAYANNFLVPLIGGSGGAGGQFFGGNAGSGGAGGGALLIASSTSITVNGTIQANGGNGGGTAGFCVGGGGSGGAIHLLAPTLNIGGTLSAVGGVSFGAGGYGAQGRIRVEAFARTIAGSVDPTMLAATPFGLFLPPSPPSAVRVVSIAGVPVPSSPTGSFTMPDVTINSSTPVTVQIQARYVPLTATVKLHFFSETGPDLLIDVPSLTGTETESNTTASVTLPSGFSRGFVRATWANP